MPDRSEQARRMKELFDGFFADMTAKNRDAVDKYIDLEKELVGFYQKYITDELASNDEALQNLTKMMMASWMRVLSFQRETRTRFLEMQSSLADVHLQFLDRVKESLSSAGRPGGDKGSSDAQ